MASNIYLVTQMMQRLVDGYGGRVHGDLESDTGNVMYDIEFPSMSHATSCAETMTRHEHTEDLERLLPRPATVADLPAGTTVGSIHAPVTLRFVMNPHFMRHVVDQAARTE